MISEISLDDRYTVPGRYWHPLEDGRLRCDVCSRAFRLHEGQRGLCFVRGRVEGQVVLTSYGRFSGFCVDSIEKKPLNHFLPGSAAPCCRSAPRAATWPAGSTRSGTSQVPRDRPAGRRRRPGCRSVAMTYNDPVIFLEYAVDVADACRARGVKAVAVTAGYIGDDPPPRGTAQPRPGGQERVPDPAVVADSSVTSSTLCGDPLAQLGDPIDVGELHRGEAPAPITATRGANAVLGPRPRWASVADVGRSRVGPAISWRVRSSLLVRCSARGHVIHRHPAR